MKALSVQQPFADMIRSGEKRIEFRTWQTKYRGDLLICSSKGGEDHYAPIMDGDKQDFALLPKGVMVAVVELVDIRPMTQEDADDYGVPFDPSIYAWILDNGYAVVPYDVKGKLNLFEVSDNDIDALEEGEEYWEYDYPDSDKPIPQYVIDDFNAQNQTA